MNHIVNKCPSTKYESGLERIYKAETDAIKWLESTATVVVAVVAKRHEISSQHLLALQLSDHQQNAESYHQHI